MPYVMCRVSVLISFVSDIVYQLKPISLPTGFCNEVVVLCFAFVCYHGNENKLTDFKEIVGRERE